MNTDELDYALIRAERRVLSIQARLHCWARDDPHRRFGDLFNLVADPAFLLVAWDRVRGNKGARTAGVDGRTARSIEAGQGAGEFLGTLRSQVKDRSFRPLPAVRVKSNETQVLLFPSCLPAANGKRSASGPATRQPPPDPARTGHATSSAASYPSVTYKMDAHPSPPPHRRQPRNSQRRVAWPPATLNIPSINRASLVIIPALIWLR